MEARDAERLASRMIEGDRQALSRLLTLAERASPEAATVMRRIERHAGRAAIVGITGPPGTGKSTLVDKMTMHLRREGRTVGIAALDPSSPFSGGAILGDRIRMQDHTLDDGVFIRSLASRGSSGGLARATRDTVRLLDASGKEFCIVETVGVGQIELDVMDLADTVVVVAMPQTGDSIQAMKAGILEIADILVVNKADLPGAGRLAAQLQEMLRESRRDTHWQVPVILCEASRNIGVDALIARLAEHRRTLEESGQLLARRRQRREKEFLEIVDSALRDGLRELIRSDSALSRLFHKVSDGEIDPHSAAAEVVGAAGLLRDRLVNRNVDL